MLSIRVSVSMIAVFTLLGSAVQAQETPRDSFPQTTDITIQRLQRGIAERDRLIMDLERRVEALEKRAATAPALATRTAEPAPGATKFTENLVAPKASTDLYDEEERKARATLDSMLISRSSLLLRPWTMEIHHSVTYYSSSADQVSVNGYTVANALVVGDIFSARVRRDIVLGDMTTRLGLPKSFQVEARVPYGYEKFRNINADNTETSSNSYGIGDVEAALYKQLHHQTKNSPDVLVGFRWKSTTGEDPFEVGVNVPTLGNGFNSFQSSLTLAKKSDPVVFLGGISYTRSLAADKQVIQYNPDGSTTTTPGLIAPGDIFGFNAGTVLALNSQASFLVSYTQNVTRSASLNGTHIPGSFLNAGLLQLGGSYMYGRGRTLDLTLGIGLSKDSPDFQLTLGTPFRFSLKPKPSSATTVKNDSGSVQTSPTNPATEGAGGGG